MNGVRNPCIFCGAVGFKLTKEHVYPRWLHRALNIRGNITYSSAGRAVRVVSELDVQLRDVCESCNNEWLHDLERVFRAVMLWPMNGLAAIVMPHVVQQIVALWAIKTWLLLEHTMAYVRGMKALEPQPAIFRYLREHNEPPPTAQIWIGAVDAVPAKLISFIATKWVGTPPDPPIGMVGVFTIGCLVFHVYMPARFENDAPSAPFELGIGDRLAPFLTQIWPHQTDEVEWPPSGIFSADDLKRVWPDGGHIQPVTL